MSKDDGVIVAEGEDLSAVKHLQQGTPIAVCNNGQWWPYLSMGKGLNNPVGSHSFSTAETALHAARTAPRS